MTDEERLVLTETRRLWIQTARSRNPREKISEPQYGEYFDCPACKYHGNSLAIRQCPGDCILSPVWGSVEKAACEFSSISPYDKWRISAYKKSFNSRRGRSAAWKLINGIETMLWNDRLANA